MNLRLRFVISLAISNAVLFAALDGEKVETEQSAAAAVAANHFAEARTIYRTLESQYPDRSDYSIWVGRLSGWLADYVAASNEFQSVLRHNPDNLEALLGQAYVLLWQRRYREAEEVLRKAESLQPDNPEITLAWAKRFRYGGDRGAAAQYVGRALTLDPTNRDALEMQGELAKPDSVELIFGYGADRFSFAPTGQSGWVSGSWLNSRGNTMVRYEEWSRFGQRATRGGFGGSLNVTPQWTIWASSLFGSNGAVFATQDHSLGFSRKLTRGWVLGSQYRYLKFDQAKVQIVAPSLEYYFKKSAWVSATAAWSTTAYAGVSGGSDQSGAFRILCHKGITHRLAISGGYARGTESFSDLSFDRIGHFVANTYIGGGEFRLNRNLNAGVDYLWLQRSTGATQQSLNLRLLVRR